MSEAAPGAIQRLFAREHVRQNLRILGLALIEYGLVAYGLFKLTEKLSKISGNALWLPEPWRNLLLTFLPGLGVLLYLFMKVLLRAGKAGVKRLHPAAEEPGGWPRLALDGASLGLGICLTIWAISQYFTYSSLGHRCDKRVQLTTAQWDAIAPTTQPSPPFCDRERGTFLVPPEESFDPEWRAMAVGYGKEERGLMPLDPGTPGVDYFGAGLERIFTEAPDEYIAWAQGAGSKAVAEIKVRFAQMHLFIVMLVAIAAGFSSSPLTAIGETVTNLLKGRKKDGTV